MATPDSFVTQAFAQIKNGRAQIGQVSQTLAERAVHLGIKPPTMVVVQYDAPEAFTMKLPTGAYITAVSTGLINSMTDQEVLDAMTHEMSHIKLGHSNKILQLQKNHLSAQQLEAATLAIEKEADQLTVQQVCEKAGMIGGLNKLMSFELAAGETDPMTTDRLNALKHMKIEKTGKGCIVR